MAEISSVTIKVNGQTYNLKKGSDGAWTTTATAPTESSGSNNRGLGPGIGQGARGLGFYDMEINAMSNHGVGKGFTGTGNQPLSNLLQLKVLEKTAPTVRLLSPTDGATIKTSKPEIKFEIEDNGSGPNPNECYVKIDNGNAEKVTGTVDGAKAVCSVVFTPKTNISDGNHTVTVYGYDYDGNKSPEVSGTFLVDTTPPMLNVSRPSGSSVNIGATGYYIEGTTNDELSSPVSIEISVNGTKYNPTVSGGAFKQRIDLKDKTANRVIITATDSAGLTSKAERTINVDTAVPEITAIEIVPNPVDGGKTYTIRVTARIE